MAEAILKAMECYKEFQIYTSIDNRYTYRKVGYYATYTLTEAYHL